VTEDEDNAMQLTDAQIAEYEDRGFLIFPGLVDPREIAILRDDLSRVMVLDTPEVTREKSGAVRTVFRVHDPKSPTASQPFEALARLPRVMGPAQQLLRDDALYVYHSKCNMKEAIKGEIWQWHQDYGSWRNDGVPTPTMTTALLMLDEATEIGGCLYFIPGSHKLGRFEAELDSETTSYRLWTVPKLDVLATMERFGDPVAVTGVPGTVVLFHPNLVHGSGHNMSRYSRWHIYTVYNTVANRPPQKEGARPEWVVSRDTTPLQMVGEDAIFGFRQAAE
jgi:ectoine hydroxylase